jgi:DNA-binding transcriptional LysR family regulator
MKRNFDDLLLGSIELFCLAAELSSFTAAAAWAGGAPRAGGRGAGRQIRLTDGGRAYFEQCRQALSQLVDAERLVTGEQAAPAGLLRISMPTPYAHYRVLPLLSKFRKLYPQVQLDVHISNRNIDFADEGYDLAIRGRAPDDSSLIARKLEDAELVLAATPSYLTRAGKPKTLDDLQKHECIQFELPSTGRRIPWTFRVDGKDVDVATPGSYCCSEDVLGVATLGRSGAGLVQTYRYILEKELKSGELVEVMPQFGGSSRPFILLYPHARHLSLRVRTFVEFLVENLAKARR